MTQPRRRHLDAPGLVACGIGGRRRLMVRRARGALRRAVFSRYLIAPATAIASKLTVNVLSGHHH